MGTSFKMGITAKSDYLLSCLLLLPCLCSALYFSDDNPFLQDPLQDFDLPVFYQQNKQLRNPFTAAYPVVKNTYDVELMQPLEAMPGKKTVTLYVVPQNALKVHPTVRRFKRANSANLLARLHGIIPPPPTRYPEYLGLTDGSHIPAVEIPLRKPLVIRSVEARVTAPAGFMVPFQGGDGAFHAYPMNTGCLIAPIPPNTPVSPDNPYTVRRLFAVPNLPEYPTYKPVVEQHNHLHIHGQEDADLSETLAQYFPTPKPEPTFAVFELVPVTEKNKKKKDKKKKKKDSSEESEEEDEEDDEEDKKKDKKKKDDKTTTTTTTTTTEATTTTTTEATTTAAASSIQDIIASLSSNRRFEQERLSGSRAASSLSSNPNPFRNYEKSSDLASRETSYLQQLRQQSLRRQLDQLQKLLSSLNLGSSDRSLESK